MTDAVLGKIVVFDQDDNFLKTYEVNKTFRPAGISLHDNKLYVTDIKAGTVVVLDADNGEVLQTIGEDNKMFWPAEAAVNPATGNVLVVQTGAALVSEFDPQGNHLRNFGNPGDRPGDFARPKSMTIDENGYIYVTDVAFNNVQLFDKDHRILMTLGGVRRGGVGFVLPAGITTDKKNIKHFQQYADPDFTIEYLLAVSSQGTPSPRPGNYSAVDIFGFGRKKGADYGDN